MLFPSSVLPIPTNKNNFTVVQQQYESEVNNEYVIRGNSAILKCSIPSFVADFVNVISWHDEAGNSFTLNGSKDGEGKLIRPKIKDHTIPTKSSLKHKKYILQLLHSIMKQK